MKTLTPEPAAATEAAGFLDSLRGFVRGWDRFWFSAADPTTLGFIRVCTGVVMLFVHLCYTYDLMSYVHPQRAWLDAEAVHFLRDDLQIYIPAWQWDAPNEQVGTGQYTWSVYFHLGDERAIYAAHAAILVSILLFTLGLWTRVTAVLAWAGALSYIHRAPTMLFGMDTMQTILMTYLVIGPSGAALSLDRWLWLRRERARRGDPNYAPPPEPSVGANLAIRLIQVHFCFIYMASGLSKLLGPAWWNGTALWLCLANYSFAPMEFPIYNRFLLLLAGNRPLFEWFLTGGAAGTLFLEIGLPFLVWNRSWRPFMVMGLVLLHTGIGVTMGLVSFSMLMMVLGAAFVPPEAVRYLLRCGSVLFRRGGDAAAPPPTVVRSEGLALSRAQ